MCYEGPKGRLDVKMQLIIALQRAIPERKVSFPVATAGEYRGVLERRPTTIYHATRGFQAHPRSPATAQPRYATTPRLRGPCPGAKPQMLLVLTIRHVPTRFVTSLV